jgi:hypothetical protein
MFVILLFIFLLILIIVNIILISNASNVSIASIASNSIKKKLVYGDGVKKKLVYGGTKTKNTTKNTTKDKAKNMTKKIVNHPSGWQLYTLENCEHCNKQMEKLGKFNTYIKYKEDSSGILVNNIDGPLYSKHIEGFPFWYNSITGEERYGGQEMDNLLAI